MDELIPAYSRHCAQLPAQRPSLPSRCLSPVLRSHACPFCPGGYVLGSWAWYLMQADRPPHFLLHVRRLIVATALPLGRPSPGREGASLRSGSRVSVPAPTRQQVLLRAATRGRRHCSARPGGGAVPATAASHPSPPLRLSMQRLSAPAAQAADAEMLRNSQDPWRTSDAEAEAAAGSRFTGVPRGGVSRV